MVEVMCDYPPCGKRFKKIRSKTFQTKHNFHSMECRIAYDREYGVKRRRMNLWHQRKLQEWADKYRENHGSAESNWYKEQLKRDWEKKRIAAGKKRRVIEKKLH